VSSRFWDGRSGEQSQPAEWRFHLHLKSTSREAQFVPGTASALAGDRLIQIGALAAEESAKRIEKSPKMFRSNSISGRALQCLILSLAIFAFSGASDPSTRFNEIGHQLMCICGCGEILLECNHVGCPDSDGMRNELMAAVTRGDSDSLVQQAFVQKYGPTVLAAPTTSGFDRTAWILPIVAFALGLLAIIFVVRSWKNRLPKPPTSCGPPVGDAELEKFRQQALKETEV
jgi:cytochrome c-type biogenesis protein CcmH